MNLSKKELMALNRRDRRILGSREGIKIPGSTAPYVNWAKKARKK
jgi:hypothetical protein